MIAVEGAPGADSRAPEPPRRRDSQGEAGRSHEGDSAIESPPEIPEERRTRRQLLVELLSQEERSFDELREIFQIPVRDLEEALRHVARSLHRGPRRLVVVPARCHGCDFVFEGRRDRHLRPPGRCPHCHGRRIGSTRFRVE